MKLRIPVKLLSPYAQMPLVIAKGDWVDLSADADIDVAHTKPTAIPLGIAIALPLGYEALVVPRSSTCKKFGIIAANSVGIIDNTYRGNDDQWHFLALALHGAHIKRGARIAQFRIQLSQKATAWQRIKSLFYSGIEFVQTSDLGDQSRGGFGTTGHEPLRPYSPFVHEEQLHSARTIMFSKEDAL